jgi:hypothetical protein
MTNILTGMEVSASADVTPGPLRRAVAQTYSIGIREVTAEDVERYLSEQEAQP